MSAELPDTVSAALGSAGPLPTARLCDIATGLAASADAWRDRLLADPHNRTGLRLVATDRYDVWLLRWPPSTAVTPHDHGGSAGVFTVVSGRLTEHRWGPAGRSTSTVGPGEVVEMEAAVVHDVLAERETALSVHVYSPPLSSMSYYDATGTRVVFTSLVDDGPLEADQVLFPAGRTATPAAV